MWISTEALSGRVLNAIMVCILLGTLSEWFAHRFLIGHDLQSETCLHGGHRWFLIDRGVETGKSGDLLAFRADERMAPEIETGTLVVKRIEAIGGDVVKIAADSIENDGSSTLLPYPHRTRLRTRALEIGRRIKISEGGYFVLGDHPRSFDSRYFGEIRKEQVVGLAHVLF